MHELYIGRVTHVYMGCNHHNVGVGTLQPHVNNVERCGKQKSSIAETTSKRGVEHFGCIGPTQFQHGMVFARQNRGTVVWQHGQFMCRLQHIVVERCTPKIGIVVAYQYLSTPCFVKNRQRPVGKQSIDVSSNTRWWCCGPWRWVSLSSSLSLFFTFFDLLFHCCCSVCGSTGTFVEM